MVVDGTPGLRVEQVRRDFEALDAGAIEATSLYGAILDSARRFPDKPAVIELLSAEPGGATRQISYADMADGITRRANVLRSLGLRAGDPVLFLPPQSLDALLAFWAAQAGAAVAPVNAFLGPAAIAEIARGCGARAIISGPAGAGCGTFALAEAVMRQVPGIAHHLVIAGPAGEKAIDLAAAACERAGSELDGPAPTLDDIGAFFPTGGTTGAPKIARLSHRNLLVGSFAAAHVTSLDEDHVVPAGLPLFHVGGGVIGTTRAMLLGHTLVLLTDAGYRSPAVVANFWKLARDYGFTQIITVPTAFGDLLRTYDGEGHAIGFATAGASKLPPSLVDDYRKTLGIDLLEGYGMTECSGFCTANPRGLPARAGSGGLQSPFYRVKIVMLDDEQRFVRDCASGELGHIAVSGPGVFEGYIDPRQTQEKLIAGMPGGERWIDAGDLGTLDNDGYLWVVGRAKDLIIRGGHNIDPAPIEDALLQHPSVADAAVVALPDARVGELPIAFVQLDEGAALDADAIRAFCAEHVPDRAGVPVRVIALGELPRTAMRKIFKPELRRQAAQLAVDGLGRGDLRVVLEPSGLLFAECPPEPPADLLAALDRLNLRIRIRETLA